MDNENIQLLRLRSFTIGKPLSDEDLQSTGAQDRIAALIGIMEPFVSQQSLPPWCPVVAWFPSPLVRVCVYWVSVPAVSVTNSVPSLFDLPQSSTSVIQFSGVPLGAKIPTYVGHLVRSGKGVEDNQKKKKDY